jgi:hypothetical protein
VRRTRIAVVGLVVGGLLAMTASASALTLGTTTFPVGAVGTACTSSGAFYVQSATDSAYDYSVPSGGGQIDSWSTNTQEATAGAPLSLVVLRPNGAEYTVVGFDSETLPSPLPPSGIATFNIASPIAVNGGDLLGLYGNTSAAACSFKGGSPAIPAGEVISAGIAGPPSVGLIYKPTVSAGGFLVNVAVDLVQSEDVSVTGSAMPSSITAGGVSAYAFTVTNGGVGSGPITFTDAVPSGLGILSAVAGSGSCSSAGQAVTCTISGLAAGASAPVSIIVSAPNAGSYADAASVSASLPDPNPANNSASATLVVNAPTAPPAPAPNCKVVQLAGTPLAVAKVVIGALNCKVGKITSKASKTVPKGLVISTSPGSGAALAAGSAVNIVTSSGPPKKHKKKKKH